MSKHKWTYVKSKKATNGPHCFELVEDNIDLGIDFADETSAKRVVGILNDYEKKTEELNDNLKRVYDSLNGG